MEDELDGEYKFANCAHRAEAHIVNKSCGLCLTTDDTVKEGHACQPRGIKDLEPRFCHYCLKFKDKNSNFNIYIQI